MNVIIKFQDDRGKIIGNAISVDVDEFDVSSAEDLAEFFEEFAKELRSQEKVEILNSNGTSI